MLDDCPLCLERGVTLEVGNHRSNQLTGKRHSSCLLLLCQLNITAVNLILYVGCLL